MNYKHNANGLPYTVSNYKIISQQNNNFDILWQTIFLSYHMVGVQIL